MTQVPGRAYGPVDAGPKLGLPAHTRIDRCLGHNCKQRYMDLLAGEGALRMVAGSADTFNLPHESYGHGYDHNTKETKSK